MLGTRLAAASGGLSALAFGLLLVAYLIPVYVPEPSMAAGNAPGPQAVPLTLAWGLIIFGGLEAVTVLLSGERVQWNAPDGAGRLFLVGAIVLATLLLMPLVGMLAIGSVMMVAITTLASGQRVVPSLVTAVVFVAVVYGIFVWIAGIPLPNGTVWG